MSFNFSFFGRKKHKNVESLEKSTLLINHIISLITEENLNNNLTNFLYSYFEYRDSCNNTILDIINEQIKNKNSNTLESLVSIHNFSYDEIRKASENILINNNDVNEKFIELFITRFNSNIKEAEQNEQEAIIYHNSFGQEPDGDPKLHDKINDEEFIDESSNEEKNINDLDKLGTVEDVE